MIISTTLFFFQGSFCLTLVVHMTLSIHTELKMKSGILLLKMRSAIFLPLEIILQTVILGKLVSKFWLILVPLN